MTLTKQEFAHYIRQFSFRELFNDMGWNNDKTKQPIIVDNLTFSLQAVAQKSGFKILLCPPLPTGQIPDYNTRKKIETKVTKLFQEHLLIFGDAPQQEQIWQLVVRQTGQPTKVTETRYHISQDPQLLYQRASGLIFELDEEEKITIVDVTQRVAANFQQNNEKVTKQFYDKFKREHTTFLAFIKGIDDRVNQDWYASLMLNRLMFCYFIQKKGFLDNNKNYLREKLQACRVKKGQNKFYSFYRNFLLALFHQGLGAAPHSPALQAEIGRIPYLNGGLFEEHELEQQYPAIEIDDRAFESIFNFFDQYEWHLDTRLTASGKDINPDVIGYIFEKYINDRAQMGAYYTKEDITEYIGKNCILPYMFDETQRRYPAAFTPTAELWQRLQHSGDDYIYDAVKYGLKPADTLADLNLWSDLPPAILAGLEADDADLVTKRKAWNQPAPPTVALPTEIWREVIDRRRRYAETRRQIESGQLGHINDFITYNLNIRQFAQDTLENSADPDLIKHFYQTLTSVTILDPTAGSGAFLFAALNILEPLYQACLQRMENFVREAPKGKFKFFEETLAQVNSPEHPNRPYFIYKTIILNNLHGVDIMKEAVEIAKLRLFLKLVAAVEVDYRKPNLGLEPLPDVDFNIRAGNTLIGFATEAELDKALTYTMDGLLAKPTITEKMEIVARAFQRFKAIQLTHPSLDQPDHGDLSDFKQAKAALNKRLKELNHQLNQLLYQRANALHYDQWLTSHKPFHWLAEFYEIIHGRGGFDVIIGNPPYLELRQIEYQPKNLKTYSTGAVHNMCIERSLQILRDEGNISMIVPLAIVCTQRMVSVQNLLENNKIIWYSNFAWRPGKLFENVNRALTIFVSNSSTKSEVYSTKYLKWQSDTREQLFPNLNFISWNEKRISFWVPKLGDHTEKEILNKILSSNYSVSFLLSKNSSNRIYYRSTGGLYWKIFTNFSPEFYLNGKKGNSSRETFFAVKEKKQDVICVALLSSGTFWWWYTVTSNLRDLNPSDIQGFKFPKSLLTSKKLLELGEAYLRDVENNSTMLTRIQKQTGETQTQSFKVALSKPIIDEIDAVLAEHYGFTAEELDFIINYDIKYRMGKELEGENQG